MTRPNDRDQPYQFRDGSPGQYETRRRARGPFLIRLFIAAAAIVGVLYWLL